MDHSIRPLDIHTICELARDAAERHIPLEQANTYEGHIAAAFEGAYKAHAQQQAVTA